MIFSTISEKNIKVLAEADPLELGRNRRIALETDYQQ